MIVSKGFSQTVPSGQRRSTPSDHRDASGGWPALSKMRNRREPAIGDAVSFW